MSRSAIALAAITLAAGICVSQGASAIVRNNVVNGTGACQGALPSFEGNLRKRPTAIANEGTANAFVSCSIPHDESGNSASEYGLILNNNGAASASVTCTLVAGIKLNGANTPTFITKTSEIAANGVTQMTWVSSDNQGDELPKVANWSCNLPPGTEVGAIFMTVEDGSVEAPAT